MIIPLLTTTNKAPTLKYLMTVIFLVNLLGCATVDLSVSELEYASINEQGIDAGLINDATQIMATSKIDSMIISHQSNVILERYNNGYTAEDTHDLRSATKSMTSLLIGIAIDKGFIDSVDQPILDFFPEYANNPKHFAPITLQHLLTMTSGLDSNDWDKHSPGHEEKMYRKRSWIKFFFSLDSKHAPGEVFQYSTAGVVVLGEIISRASGMSFEAFAQKYLFNPLAIDQFLVKTTKAGEADSGGHIQLTPRDFSKIGQLFLDNGKYNGQRVVSEDWIRESSLPRIKIDRGIPEQQRYEGYLWWLEPVVEGEAKSIQARGNGGQYLIMIPDMDLVCTFTGSAYNKPEQMLPFHIVQKYILPAIQPAME